RRLPGQPHPRVRAGHRGAGRGGDRGLGGAGGPVGRLRRSGAAAGRRTAYHVDRPTPAGTVGRVRAGSSIALPGNRGVLRTALVVRSDMRALRRILILLVVLVALLAVADRVAAWAAQRAVAEKV